MGRGKDKYNFGRTGANGRSRGGKVMLFIDSLMFLFTLLGGVALLCAYLSRHVSPDDIWILAFAGLAAPTLYIINIAFILYWAIRWKLVVVIPAVAVLIGIGNISLFFRPYFSKGANDPKHDQVTVISYNVMGFMDKDERGKYFSTVDSVAAFTNRSKADIFCIQEFQAVSAEQKNRIDSLIGLRYNKVNFKMRNSAGGGWGLAVYSRYPVIDSGAIDYPDSNNSSMWVDIVANRDTVRIFNNHLQTTAVDGSDREYITSHEMMQNTPDRDERVRGIASKLKRNYIIRAGQADTLAPLIKSSPYSVIVAGDFNDTPMSYAYSRIRGDMKDSFVEKGRGMTTNTYKGLFNLFRIDYVLHSKDINTLNYATPAIEYSDHKPVVVGLSLPNK